MSCQIRSEHDHHHLSELPLLYFLVLIVEFEYVGKPVWKYASSFRIRIAAAAPSSLYVVGESVRRRIGFGKHERLRQ